MVHQPVVKIISCAFLTYLFLSSSLFSDGSKAAPQPQKTTLCAHKKKIIIFSSTGGGGHTFAAETIQRHGNDDYQFKIVNLFAEVLLWPGEGMYNYFLQKKWIRSANTLAFFGQKIFTVLNRPISSTIARYIRNEKADLVISVIPLVNHSIIRAAQKVHVPCLTISLDRDASLFINGMKPPYYEHFKYTVAFDDKELIQDIMEKTGLKEEQIVYSGFPLRPDFFEKKDITKLKEQLKIPPTKPVVMILMGAAGSVASYRYVKELAKFDSPLHIIACIGRDGATEEKIKKLTFNPCVSHCVIGYTPRISDFMAVSTLLITKPGAMSICEGLHMNLPLLIDYTSPCLSWEKLHISLIKERKFGETITRFKDTRAIVKKYLYNSNDYKVVKQNLIDFKKEHFGIKIKTLISTMLHPLRRTEKITELVI